MPTILSRRGPEMQAMNTAACKPGLCESLGIDHYLRADGAIQVDGKHFDPTHEGFGRIVAEAAGR